MNILNVLQEGYYIPPFIYSATSIFKLLKLFNQCIFKCSKKNGPFWIRNDPMFNDPINEHSANNGYQM